MHINTKTKTWDLEISQVHGVAAGSSSWNVLSSKHSVYTFVEVRFFVPAGIAQCIEKKGKGQ